MLDQPKKLVHHYEGDTEAKFMPEEVADICGFSQEEYKTVETLEQSKKSIEKVQCWSFLGLDDFIHYLRQCGFQISYKSGNFADEFMIFEVDQFVYPLDPKTGATIKSDRDLVMRWKEIRQETFVPRFTRLDPCDVDDIDVSDY